MKIRDIIEQIRGYSHDLPVMMDTGKSKAVDFNFECIFEDGKVSGLIIVEDRQLKLPFDARDEGKR